MDRQRHARISELFEQAVQRVPAEREPYLREACGGDLDLLNDVLSLLHHDAARSRIEDPFGLLENQGWLPPPAMEPETPISPSQRPEYRVVRSLGAGGMGQVFEAEQISPIRRTVAIKVVRAGLGGLDILRRFEFERQALAMMDHPNVARVFDAGLTDSGQPFFVMEYVQGLPITAYCDEHRLPVRDRLELFRRVCAGVEHAHRMAIIHRDLKPSNVLIAEVDGVPVPKIIDFGVAKAAGGSGPRNPLLTVPGVLIGTPEYMSPEQAGGSGEGVDTRTDVYSLGVMLYELLTGRRPFEASVPGEEDSAALRRRIQENEPTRPSTRVARGNDRVADLARRRGVEPRVLARQIRGDLDWIVMRALEKDRERRYPSPAELAADLGRHLRNEPVEAGPPGTRYRAAKFIRRHRVGVSAAASIAAVLMVFAASMAVQAGRIAAERDRVRRANRDLESVVEFQSGMLSRIDPEQVGERLIDDLLERAGEARRRRGDPEADVAPAVSRLRDELQDVNATDLASGLLDREILAPSDSTIGERFSGQPAIESRLRGTLAGTYFNLGIFDPVESQYRRAIALRDSVFGEDDSLAVQYRSALALLYYRKGRFTEAEPLDRRVLRDWTRLFGPDDAHALAATNILALCLTDLGRGAEAESLYLAALPRARRFLGDDDPVTVTSVQNLGLLYMNRGDLAEAEPYMKEAMQSSSRSLGLDAPRTLKMANTLAGLYTYQGKFTEAESLYQDTLSRRTRSLGRDHVDTVVSEGNLGFMYLAAGRYAEAESLITGCLPRLKLALGATHPNVLITELNLADCYIKDGKYDEARACYLDLYALQAEKRPSWLRADDIPYRLASVEARRGDRARALIWLRRSIDAGFADPDSLRRDPTLAPLRSSPEFGALVERAAGNRTESP